MILNIFFSIKLIRQFRRAKKNFMGGKLPKALPKNTIFQNSKRGSCPSGVHQIHPWV
jgi:hypothetical protein